MVKPAYLLAAFLVFLVFMVGLMFFVFGPDSGPFDKGYSSGAERSLVSVK